jgi:ComF family protein
MKLVYNCLNIIQNALLPATCILCGNHGFNGLDMCEICRNRLTRNISCCSRCAETFVSPVTAVTLCGRCLKETPTFDATVAPFTHQDEIRYLINGLKFGSQFKNARLLGRLLAETIAITSKDLPDCIIPVPLHSSRYHERGFNQSLEIARTVAQILDVGINPNVCIRHKDTSHQTGLSAKKRRINLRRAFSVVKPLVANHVAILDDVMTTGTTVNELAKVLKQAGASRVDVWVCARA